MSQFLSVIYPHTKLRKTFKNMPGTMDTIRCYFFGAKYNRINNELYTRPQLFICIVFVFIYIILMYGWMDEVHFFVSTHLIEKIFGLRLY